MQTGQTKDPNILARSAGLCCKHSYTSVLHVSFKPRPHLKKHPVIKTEVMWVVGSHSLQERKMGGFLFFPSSGEHVGLALFHGFVTGVEEKVVGLVSLCLFRVFTTKETLK